MPSRRTILSSLSALGVTFGLSRPGWAGSAPATDRLAEYERQVGGTLGVTILDTGTGRAVSHRGDERFPLCSTHKALSVAFVLDRVDKGDERLDRRVMFGREALVANAPLTTPHAGRDGMTMAELCAAAIAVSDNTAANLLLDSFGGPSALTAFLRQIGDGTTRLDRRELALNEARPGDPRDTTTPAAMAATLAKLAAGDVLSPASRTQYVAWLAGCTTGLHKLRAGLPADWRVGDKTGSGGRRAGNDVAVAWPPGRPPLVIAAYSIDPTVDDASRDGVFAAIGRLAAAA
jgi:beta-lactamase class A